MAIWDARLPDSQLNRLLVAYLCFYHLGLSAWLSEAEGDDYWELMLSAAKNETKPNQISAEIEHDRFPRGTERRHFRGKKCVDAVRHLSKIGSPDVLIQKVTEVPRRSRVNTLPLRLVMERIQEWPMFGDWIAFKAADLLERVTPTVVNFPSDILTFYKEPRAGLNMIEGDEFENIQALVNHFHQFPAPPTTGRRIARPCDIPECETILCKWKSSLGGHYHIGKDIHEIRTGLIGWGETAQRLLDNSPPEVQ